MRIPKIPRRAKYLTRLFFLAVVSLTVLFYTLPFLPSILVLADGPTTFTNAAVVTINDSVTPPTIASPYPSNIVVSAMAGTITKVTVTLNSFSHSRPDNCDIVLVGPTGANLIIMSDAGDTNAVTGLSLVFDDAASGTLSQNGVLASGTFKPTDHNAGAAGTETFPAPGPASTTSPGPAGAGTLASQFNGTNPNGTWSLYVVDDAAGGVGTRQLGGGWSITITTAAAAATTTTVSSNNNPSFTTAPNNAVTLTANVTSTSTVNEGTVSFTDNAVAISGCTAVAVVSGSAQCNTSFSTEGNHPIVASYNGTANFNTSNGSLTQVVDNHTVINPGNEFCNTGTITIVDSGTPPTKANIYPSHIFVTGLSGVITSVTLELNNLNHSRGDDIDILLVGPGGQKFVVLSDVGGALQPATNVTLTLADAAGSLVPNSGSISSGTFKPTDYGTGDSFPSPAPVGPYNEPATAGAATFASVFNGAGANGTWSLYVVDDAAGGAGTTNIAGGWCVTFTTSATQAATTTTVSSNNNPSFTTAPNNAVTFTATTTSTSTVNEGTTSFTDNGSPIAGCTNVAVVSGTAQCNTSFASEGNHVILASYSGTINFGPSNGSLTQEVNNHTVVNGNEFCNTGVLTINDSATPPTVASPYPSRIFVSGLAGTIAKITVDLKNLTHPRSDNLDLLLVGPNGATLVVMSDTGGSLQAVAGATLTLDDTAGSQLPSAGSVVSGTFRPTDYSGTGTESFPAPAPVSFSSAAPTGAATFASQFNGINPNGTWSLYVVDDSSGGAGTSNIAGGWCLDFTLNAATWTGAGSTDWHTAANWSTNAVPGSGNDVNIPSSGVTNEPTISNSDVTVNSLNIANGRTLTINGGRTLTISGAAAGSDLTLDGIISGGALNFAGGGPHVINNAGGTGSLSSTNLATVLSGSTVTLNNNLQAGALAVNAGGSMNITNRTLSLNGSGAALVIAGGATFTTTGSTVVFNGTAAQQAAGITYNNLTINNTLGTNVTGVTLTGNATLNGALALTSSDLDTGAFTLTQPNTTASTGVSDVVGTVTRSGGPFAPAVPLTFGHPDNRITFNGATGTKPSTVTVTMAKAAPATYAAAVQRNYTISQTGGSGFTSTLRLHYLDSELNGNSETPDVNFNLRKGPSPSWGAVVPTARDTAGASNWLENNAVTSFSQWTFATLAPTASTSSISGILTKPDGSPLGGVVLQLNNGRRTITRVDGKYLFEDIRTNEFYTLTPLLANHHFTPASRSFSLTGNMTNADFNAADNSTQDANPLDTDMYFVRQQYLDILGREPDEGGLQYWTAQINGGCTVGDTQCINNHRIDVAAAFFIALEFQQSGSFIYDVYSGALGRRPLYVEYAADRQQVIGGANLDEEKDAFAQAFVQRPEFVQKYQAATTAELFVDALIRNVQQVSGVDLNSHRDALIARYQTGANQTESRGLVVRDVADDTAFKQAQYNPAFVLTEYFGYLRRDPDPGGYAFWLDVLNNSTPGNYRGMVCAFVTSAEYHARFSTVVTHTNAECGQ
jgi:subtilisin-like proprotein convertase family protein